MERFAQRLNQPPDPREDFLSSDAFLFFADKLESLDLASGEGKIAWGRRRRKPRVAFSHMTKPVEAVESWEFPAVFPEPKVLPFRLDFVSERCVRLRLKTRPLNGKSHADLPAEASAKVGAFGEGGSVMLQGPVPASKAWKAVDGTEAVTWTSAQGSLTLGKDPWSLTLKDAAGKVLLQTHGAKDGRCMVTGRPQPFSFVRRDADLGQHVGASFHLFEGEQLFGCGESFTRLDKRGQSLHLWTQDAHGTQTSEMYKPVPFYLSNRGYGVFMHASTPMLFDLGDSYNDTQVLYNGHEDLDLFLFIGGPKEALSEYTALTGRSPLPPLWSFGLWMSRITYESEEQTRGIAAKLKEHRIPCDVIHLDTGWFEHDWCCDYEFSKTRFKDPAKMIADLKAAGQKICLWQLPYFTPKNRLYDEIIKEGLAVKGEFGGLTSEEAILDFSNPKTVTWYQKKLEGLLKLGVAAIKVDFGEGAPLAGRYHSGVTGWQEHNLYPLRYNKAASEVGQQVHGYPLIWARSAWAGSQRYPLHWGGDAEASDGGMLGSLRGGLSFGLSGFSFWSHDVGGFFPATPRELYLRWLPFGLLSSHSRCHGLPPTEPWEFDQAFQDEFRQGVELRYSLMPYLWAQAAASSKAGHPLLRPLFFEFPADAGAWKVEDQYLLGSDILVAPLFEAVKERELYLPGGAWVDLQTGKRYAQGWHRIAAGPIQVLILGREGAAIPTLKSALHTGAQDWSQVEVLALGQAAAYQGLFCPPEASEPLTVSVTGSVSVDPKAGKRSWTVKKLG